MKKIPFHLLLAIIIINNFSFQASSSETNQNIPFKLQRNDEHIKIIYGDVTGTNVNDVILELNVSSLNSQLFLVYHEKIGGSSYKSVELHNNDYIYKPLTTKVIYLSLENQNDEYRNYTAKGFYRIHKAVFDNENIWNDYVLNLSQPYRMNIFKSEQNWVNSITISITVNELTSGLLSMEYSYTDYSYSIPELLEKNSSYQFTINTSNILLNFVPATSNYSRATGFYSIIDNGKLFTVQDMDLPFLVIIMPIFIYKVFFKRKKNIKFNNNC